MRPAWSAGLLPSVRDNPDMGLVFYRQLVTDLRDLLGHVTRALNELMGLAGLQPC